MLLLSELNPHGYETTPEIDANLATLLERINQVRTAWGKPMTVTSGLRSEGQQQGLIRNGISKATHSNHLTGSAVDVLDRDGSFYDWCKANDAILSEIGLWMEERQGSWQHFQIVPPLSGRRWFWP
jgi:hypothetical protein